MKQPKDKIHKLIHAMTPAEKRYFKRHYAPSPNNLTKLFDVINGQDSYDEDLVKKQFEDSKIAKNLKVYKVQLQNLILKSLTSYHSKNNAKSLIRSGLEEVDVLIHKQLYTFAQEQLEKVKRTCIKYEEYTYLIEIFYKEFRLYYIENDSVGIDHTHRIFEDVQFYYQQLEKQIQFSIVSAELMDYRKKKIGNSGSEEDLEFEKKIQAKKPLHFDPEQLSFRSKLSRNVILANLAYLKKDPEAEQLAKKQNVEIFDEQEHFKKYLSFEYLAVLLNYFNLVLHHRRYEEVLLLYQIATNFVKEPTVHGRTLVYFYYGYLKVNYDQRQFERNIDGTEKEIISLLKKNNIAKERIALLIYSYLSLSYLALEEPQKVQFYLREMQLCRPEVQNFFGEITNVIELIHHYETQDETSLKRRLSSILRKLDKKNNTEHFYEQMLRLFQQLLRENSKKSDLAKDLQKELGNYQGERVHLLFEHFNLESWLKAMVSRHSFAHQLTVVEKKRAI